VILLGEHAVVYGRPALAAGVGIGLEVDVVAAEEGDIRVESDRPELVDDPRPAALVREAAGLLGVSGGLVVRIRSALPAGAGLGSSAALAVAVVRALAALTGQRLASPRELALARRLEAIFHGHPSGIDPAAAALAPGACIRFVRGEPPQVTAVRLAAPVPLVIAVPVGARSTGVAVRGLRARWEAERARHERLFDDVAVEVEAGADALARGDLATLGAAFDRNQELLAALGVSTPASEALIATARQAGALGAKLTGGGGGGAVVALAPAREAAVVAAVRAAGAEPHVVTLGAAA
jgi:mevalonate kinase